MYENRRAGRIEDTRFLIGNVREGGVAHAAARPRRNSYSRLQHASG